MPCRATMYTDEFGHGLARQEWEQVRGKDPIAAAFLLARIVRYPQNRIRSLRHRAISMTIITKYIVLRMVDIQCITLLCRINQLEVHQIGVTSFC
jgi:hypothetical protein